MAAPAPAETDVPPLARLLGLAGLLPQLLALLVVASGNPNWTFSALALAFAYAALILSFLGGLWWGLAARAGADAPSWLWVAAVAPSLIALATAIPWAIGAAWPGPSLVILGATLIGALVVDVRLVRLGLAPRWWLKLRTPLSVGLGVLSIGTALF